MCRERGQETQCLSKNTGHDIIVIIHVICNVTCSCGAVVGSLLTEGEFVRISGLSGSCESVKQAEDMSFVKTCE